MPGNYFDQMGQVHSLIEDFRSTSSNREQKVSEIQGAYDSINQANLSSVQWQEVSGLGKVIEKLHSELA